MSYDIYDQMAEREAAALRQARKHLSVFMHRKHKHMLMDREHAVFEEKLEEKFSTCSTCGKLMRLPPQNETIEQTCNDCRFISKFAHA